MTANVAVQERNVTCRIIASAKLDTLLHKTHQISPSRWLCGNGCYSTNYRSVPQIPPPFAILALVQKAGGLKHAMMQVVCVCGRHFNGRQLSGLKTFNISTAE